ncbi:MAG TPA: hypothetical protein VJ752_22620 [Burkholderiaceae bacterium]|nr:hypothetical protein [Burkholderiaceae bacterium]
MNAGGLTLAALRWRWRAPPVRIASANDQQNHRPARAAGGLFIVQGN